MLIIKELLPEVATASRLNLRSIEARATLGSRVVSSSPLEWFLLQSFVCLFVISIIMVFMESTHFPRCHSLTPGTTPSPVVIASPPGAFKKHFHFLLHLKEHFHFFKQLSQNVIMRD